MNMFIKRIKQVSTYGWKQSKPLAESSKKGRISIFLDMFYCFFRFKMWTNQYAKENFHLKTKEERDIIGKKYYDAMKKHEEWADDLAENRKFLAKWSSKCYDLPHLTEKRNKAYRKRYNMGEDSCVRYDVMLERHHYVDGTIKIGKKVTFSRNVDIDYTGGLEIGDGVGIADGVKILTHDHDKLGIKGKSDIETMEIHLKLSKLTIEDNVTIGTRAIILAGVKSIGKNSIISAGSVVRRMVPPNVIVAGNPAKILIEFPAEIKTKKLSAEDYIKYGK